MERLREISLNGCDVSINNICDIARHNCFAKVTPETRQKIKRSRQLLEDLAHEEPIYGVTTGYGEMVYIQVENERENELQTNLIRSHAACVGPHFSIEESRAILAVRVNALCRGYSAVREELIDRLLMFLHECITPAIPEIGSLGASGDLGQLAHLALCVIGEGYAFDREGHKVPTKELLHKMGFTEKFVLKYKEGLAIINGTSAMTGVGCLVYNDAKTQIQQSEIITALALENLKASSGAFKPEGHELARPHQGQVDCAKNLLNLLKDSKLVLSHGELKAKLQQAKHNPNSDEEPVYLQKAYTLRCVPQILGAIKDTLSHVEKVLSIEINSSNDNPLFFDDKDVFHGGNFHGQPVAFAMDFLAIALTQLGVVSERRTNRLLNVKLSGGLSDFLVKKQAGLNCGFAGAQYPATALVAENRTICSPASIQSIPSNGDNQDVVSMGLVSTRNCKRILKNNNHILAVELLCAAQAVDIGSHYEKLSTIGKDVYSFVRSHVDTLDNDRFMSDDITKISELLDRGELLEIVNKAGCELK